ncbi:MAG: hypothetical protein NUV86_05175, partial [Candidatus Scalindua sp.]|nr:hypothetical protein [Candidatus Scalindua sp.]MCR4345401.1 hypothetical protein [Candidatus Scalindua sp.]
MAQKTINKNKINNESKDIEIAKDKGVNSSDWIEDRTTLIWLGKDKSNNFDCKYCRLLSIFCFQGLTLDAL